MKKSVLIIGLVLLAVSIGFSGCASTSSKTEDTPSATEPKSSSVDSTSSTAAETSSAAKPISSSFDGRWTGTTEIQGYGAIPFGYDFKSDGNKLTGTSDGQSGPMPIANGKIDGDKITFDVTINLNGQDILVNYTGVLTGDKLKLTWPGQGGLIQEVICSR
ncbi:MAG: hypothetical protein JW787_01325 [Sedimentisphaerales bacterium]|nr:hypothetical protein [Sedimentisphaerales bacterium]